MATIEDPGTAFIPSLEQLEELADRLGVAELEIEDVTTYVRRAQKAGVEATFSEIGGVAVFAERVNGHARRLIREVEELRELFASLAPYIDNDDK